MPINVDVVFGPHFRRELKPLLKKFASLADEVEALIDQLTTSPQLGTPLGKNCYKIRLAVRSKGGGKSGGIRVITYVVVQLQQRPDNTTTVYLASIFDKSERENLTDAQIKSMVAAINAAD